MKKERIPYFLFAIYLISYLFVNTTGLTVFPFVHSDESWLSGLTRGMIEKKFFAVTESFFDLFPRNPHAIKIFFHYLQSKFIDIWGYNIFSVRLLSVIFGFLSIILFFFILRKINKDNPVLNIIYSVLFSLNIQFIYASRFARQEIEILFFILIVTFFLFSQAKDKKRHGKEIFIIPVLVGISIGFHPNSFIIAIIFGLSGIYLASIGKIKKKDLIKSILLIALMASIFVFISFRMNPNFISDYMEFGKTLNVDAAPVSRFKNFIYFYTKLWNQMSITYYIPNIKALLSSLAAASLSFFLVDRKYKDFFNLQLLSVIGLNLGLFIIGRYSPLSILFLMPSLYIMAYIISISLSGRKKNIVPFIVAIATVFTLYINLRDINYENYNDYIENIKSYVSKSDKVLCNLNAEYAFDDGQMLDYRNLYYLKKNNLSFKEYILKNNINKIILSEEMDYIYRNSPKWDYLYGSLSSYYPEMKEFLEENALEIGNFTSETYGNRILKYIDTYPWTIHIYEIKIK